MRGSRRLLRRAGVVVSVLAGLTFTAAAASADPVDGFVDAIAIGGLNRPTNVVFADNGRVFVAEQGGVVKTFESINDSSPTVFADLTDEVHDFWDRGLLGLAVHPDFPMQPYVYVSYTYGVPLDQSLPAWDDACPNPPGSTTDGCVVSGRLQRLEAQWNGVEYVWDEQEEVLVNDWCQQFPSHSIGDLVFGPDGALYVSGGDGAAFHTTDYGQLGGTRPDETNPVTPQNPCGDPPNEGGALRSQSLENLDGTVIRIEPSALVSDGPIVNPDVIAYGLRNPYRMTMQPDTGTLFIGDVGWDRWEEVNVHTNPTASIRNFGWPCYEGGKGQPLIQPGYSEFSVCENLYSSGAVTAAFYAYRHTESIPGSEPCATAGGSSISGLAFYQGGDYSDQFDGALFGSDYSRGCIWVMHTDGGGDLDPATVEVFQDEASNPVDLEIGPNGDVFYVNINYGNLDDGQIRRLRYVPPVAVIQATPESGDAPLDVEFDGSQSSVPSPFSIDNYEWDFDEDGLFDDAIGESASWLYDQPGCYLPRLRVTDSKGHTDIASSLIQVSNTPPTAAIEQPSSSLKWKVDDLITFWGQGMDVEDGELPPSALTWDLFLNHSGHTHHVQTFEGASGSFTAPQHDYPSHLELRLTVTDECGVADTHTVKLQPELVDLTFSSVPSGLKVTFLGEVQPTPFTKTWIVGATVSLSTPEVQQLQGREWTFQSWAHGGDRTQAFTAPSFDATYLATFKTLNNPPIANAGSDRSVNVNQTATLDGSGSSDPDGDPLTFSWSITSRPSGSSASLAGASTSKPKLTPDVVGTYKVRLQVSDGIKSDTDDVVVQASEVKGSGDTFIDDDQSIFESSIEWMADKGITKGCNPPKNDRFCPNDFITRAQMSAFFARAFGWTDDGGGNLFVDDDKATFEHDIDLMGTAGVTRGCNPPNNDRFCPDDFVTRAQMSAFFARAFGWTDDGGGDLFVDDDKSTFEHDIDLMGTAGVTRGCNPPKNDRFCPNDFVTREQMAAFFERAWKGVD